jgi:macrolide-specific efflux system membrane fusion protein
LTTARADLAQAKQDAANLAIEAPFDGVITTVSIAVGDTVTGSSSSSASNTADTGNAGGTSPSGSSGTSTTALSIASLQTYEVSGSFAEADAASLGKDQAATISFPALDDTAVAGKVTWVSPTSTTSNSVVTYSATVQLTEIPEGLRLGQTANISVTTAEAADVLTLPANAVTVDADGSTGTVLLLDANGNSTSTTVGVGLQGDSTVEITDGLALGDSVVVSLDTATGGSSTSTTGGRGMFPGSGEVRVFQGGAPGGMMGPG